MAKTLYELYLDNMKKAGMQKASQPAVLPAIKMPTLEAPKTTPAAGSATGVKMPAVGAKKPSGVDIVKAVTQKPAAQGGGRATMPQVKKQETATDRLANIRAFGAGDYSGGGQLLEKAYKTARGAVKGIGSSYANIGGSAVEGMGNLQETMQKGEYDKKVQQMKDNKAFYEQALKTGVNPRTGKKLTVDEKSRYYKILNTQYTDGKIAQMENVYKDATANQKARTMEAANDAFAASDRLKASADKDVAAAKEGSGKAGQFLVDLGYTGTQLLADLAANAIAPGAGMVSMASRVYGDASAEARREGKTAGQQVLSGLKGATIEVLTEKLFGSLAKAYGAGTADELVKKVADKLTKTEAGQRAAVWLINSGGEGLEEVVSDVLNPLADRALGLDDGKSPIYTTDDVAQMGYDFLLGTAMGAIGGAGQLWDTKSSAPAAQETRPVQMPTLVDANGRTAAQRQAWAQLSEPQRAQLDEADKIARRFGARVELDNREGVSGSYRDGVITLNPNTANPVRQTLIHELTHHMESSGLYSRFSDTAMRYVAENMGADVESVRQAVMADYARSGVTLDEDGATREIVAKFAEEKLFTDETTVRRLLAEDRNLFQRIYDWIRDMAGRLTGTSEESFLRSAEKLYVKALRETTAETGRGTQMLFAGENARTANMQTLNRAQALEASGAAAEDIRRETGWFRGIDGKWRFEIDDSAMRYDRQGVTQNPDVQRKRQLEEKLLYGQLTQEETNELRALTEMTQGIPDPRTLSDYIQHDALFEAYPELRDAAVVFEETEPGVNGYYNAGQNTIVLDSKLRGAPESTLVHEIQHAVQRAEGFARGSTPEYWKYKNKDGQAYRTDRQYMEAEKRGRDAFDAMPDSVQDEVRRINRAKSDQDWDEVLRLEDDIYNGPYAELYSAYDLAEFDRRSRVDYYKGANYVDLYTNTAGEIEARDAAARRDYSAEQRRRRMPQLGDANTVFADGNTAAYDINPNHRNVVEQWNREGRPEGEMFILGSTGSVLQGLGAIESDIYMQGDKINRILQDHPEMTLEEIKRLPEILEDPVLVLKSKGSGGIGKTSRVVMFGTVRAQNGQPVMAVLDLRPYENGFLVTDMQKVNSSYTKKNPADFIRSSEVLYADKKRAAPLLRLTGLTIASQQLLQNGSVGSISYAGQNVNIEGTPFSDMTRREQLSAGRGLEEMQRDGVQMPVVGNAPVTTRDGNIFQPGNSDSVPAGNMSWHDVYGISERGEPVDTGSESLTTEDSAELNDYLDALAQDENAFTDDPYTVSDAVYDAKLRRLAGEEAPPETRTQEQVTQADLDELAGLFADIADPIDADKNAMTADMVSNESVPQKQSKREAVRSAWDFFYRKMVDAGHSVTKLSEAVSDPYLYQFYNQARASSSAGVNMITDAQTNARGQKVGASLNDVFSPIRAKGDGYYHDFQLYMYDLHNIDRMSLSRNKEARVMEARAALRDFDANNPDIRTDTAAQLHRMTEDPDPDMAALAREKERLIRELDRAEAIKDKPVFDYEFTAGDSRARAERLLRQHPEFTEYQAQVRKYIDNMMQYRVESGLITQEDADFLKTFYPNYVPTMRVQEKGTAGAGRDLNAVRVGKTVGRAQGGTERLLPLHEALGKQTMKVVREGSKNRFADRLLHDYIQAGDTAQVNRYIKEASRYEHDFNPDSLDDVSVERPTKDKTVTAYVNGTLWEMTVDDTLFDAVKALSPDTTESNAVTKVIRASNNLFKSLVTGYNPTFLARNVIRDLQTAGLNTRDAAAFARNYPRALAEIRNNGEYWQLYKALGGVYSSVFDYTTGTVKEPKGAMGKFMARVEALNMAAEQAPRLAEFMGVMQNAERASARGEAVNDLATAADALYAAADITVNFGRAGSLGKVLNANYVPFLNPGVQGLDKLIRRITETRGAKEWAKLVVRAAALGIAPSLLNALLYNDDDEWEDLRDSDKDTNYMFKLGNGYWLKIPKGRELSVFGIAADRVYDALRGEDVDVLSTVNTVGSQVAPANPLTSNIFSALVDSQLLNPDSPGRTWYGGDIESQRLQNYAPGERYDSSTDIFSKTVGQALGISPKKLNYVLDQYSGVVGDFLLPILTPQAERNMFAKAFTVDSMSSNRVSSDFYDEADELKYAKNGGDTAAGIIGRWWSKQQAACSDLWKQIREAEESTELSNKEKRQQTRELKAVVTGIQKNAMAVEETYREAVEKHLSSGADEDTAYRDANKDYFGAEYALQVYNKDVYQRAQDAKQNGVSYDDFYTYYFGTKDLKATTTESAVSRRFQFLRASGMSEHTQAEIYFADMASDKTLTSLADLEINAGISAEDYYLYKASSAGMTKKAEKLSAIDSLNLTAAQKDALYYSEGWAESKLHEAPWHGGQTAAVRMPVVKTTGGAPVFVRVAQSAPTVQMPVVRTTAKAPVFVRVTQHVPEAVRVVKMPVVK